MEPQQQSQFIKNSEHIQPAVDTYPRAYPNAPERLVSPSKERESSRELEPSEEVARGAILPALQTATIASPQPPTPAANNDGVVTNIPALAADDDLIEKEWVDKAKQIIAETKDNPYQREQRIGALQREYIYKRYGRKIGDVGE